MELRHAEEKYKNRIIRHKTAGHVMQVGSAYKFLGKHLELSLLDPVTHTTHYGQPNRLTIQQAEEDWEIVQGCICEPWEWLMIRCGLMVMLSRDNCFQK